MNGTIVAAVSSIFHKVLLTGRVRVLGDEKFLKNPCSRILRNKAFGSPKISCEGMLAEARQKFPVIVVLEQRRDLGAFAIVQQVNCSLKFSNCLHDRATLGKGNNLVRDR